MVKGRSVSNQAEVGSSTLNVIIYDFHNFKKLSWSVGGVLWLFVVIWFFSCLQRDATGERVRIRIRTIKQYLTIH